MRSRHPVFDANPESAYDVRRLLWIVNASELERLKKRFMKLDRCAFLLWEGVPALTWCMLCLSTVCFTLAILWAGKSPNQSPSTLTPRYQSPFFPSAANEPMCCERFRYGAAMALVRSTETSSCRSLKSVETPWHQG